MRARKMLLLYAWVVGLVHAETLTLPPDGRPEWLRRDGIVMAGSWEPLLFRVRRDGSSGYTPTPEQLAAYEREHTREMLSLLKSLGANFVMMHCYKGFGLSAERDSMTDAVRFAALCREEGLRVGVYVYSGAFGWELFFKETPQARNWVILDEKGSPVTYGGATYRCYWNRNHPDAQAFYRDIVRFAVRDIRADLIHFDNYSVGPGSDPNSVQRFRDYLRLRFTPERLKRMGVADIDSVKPPMTSPPDDLLRRAWLDFSCRSLSASYAEMSRYARSLRPDILVECNPGGVEERIRAPVHHGSLLQGGEAFWDEGPSPGYQQGKLRSRIRTYKVARRMDNIAFAYTTNPLEMAESMAFNLDCLGCICWFEYGEVVEKPGSKRSVSKAVVPFVHFFHKRRDLLWDASVVADVAVLRSFPSQLFGDANFGTLTAEVEQAVVLNRIPFQIIYDHQLSDLESYQVLVLAGCVALSDGDVEEILRYVQRGGKLCVVGPAGTHDEWMLPRKRAALDDVPSAERLNIEQINSVKDAIHRLSRNKLSLRVEGPEGLCVEFTEQRGRRLVHLVNYRSDEAANNVVVQMRLGPGRKTKSVTLAGPSHDDTEIPFEERGGMVEFNVPRVDVYEIAVVSFDKAPAEGALHYESCD